MQNPFDAGPCPPQTREILLGRSCYVRNQEPPVGSHKVLPTQKISSVPKGLERRQN